MQLQLESLINTKQDKQCTYSTNVTLPVRAAIAPVTKP